jgi:hypothetical protein
MNAMIAVVAVMLPTFIVGLLAYCVYLIEGAEDERR